ncbi:hypothetical protein FRX31_031847 [Thalictrum thalictroides]|uniref:Uncharacterized protein n=1 Tax=Thalictrum thalictroides TaxID=46969 RepID=A0A7J6V366_THATH|nr:hypothetical protein FRX31_031847 [Thalictrum thalictroides]
MEIGEGTSFAELIEKFQLTEILRLETWGNRQVQFAKVCGYGFINEDEDEEDVVDGERVGSQSEEDRETKDLENQISDLLDQELKLGSNFAPQSDCRNP